MMEASGEDLYSSQVIQTMQPKNSDPVKGGQHPSKAQRSKPLKEDSKAADTIGFVNRMEKLDSKFPPPTSCIPSSSRGGPTPVEPPKPPGHEAVTTNELPSIVPSRFTKQPRQQPIGMDSSLAGSPLHQFSPLCAYSVDTKDRLARHHVKRNDQAGHEGSQDPSGVVTKVTEESADRPECPTLSEPASHRCKECGFSTSDARNFHFHEERHKKTGNFQCPLCTYSDFSEFFLNHHVATCHNDKERKTADEDCIFVDFKAEKEEEPLLEILSVQSSKWSNLEDDPLQVEILIQEANELEINHGNGQPHQSSLTEVKDEPFEAWLSVTQPFLHPSGEKDSSNSLPKFSADEMKFQELLRSPRKELLEMSPPLDVPENPPIGYPTLPAMSIRGSSAIFRNVLGSQAKQPDQASASQPPPKAHADEMGREGPKRGRSKGKRHKAPQRSAVVPIQPHVMELNGYATSDGQPTPPGVLDDAVMSRKRSHDEEVEETVEVLHCPDCLYWARTPISFHEHYVTHKGAKAFKCSACDETFKLHSEANDHIQKEKGDPTHRKAQAVAAQPIPTPNYVAFRRLAVVPFGAVNGWNPSRVDAQEVDPDDSSGPPLDQLDGFEAFTSSSHPPNAKRKKRMRMDSAEEEEILEELDELESVIQEGFRSLEKGKRSTRTESSVLRNRMEVLKGKMEAGEIRVKELQARREDLDEKIKEAMDGKIKAELNARTRECESLRLQTSKPRGPKVSQRALEEADEIFRCAEAKVKRVESKLRDLQAQKKDLVRQVEEATKSVAETGRKLDAMKSGSDLARHFQGDPPAGHQGNAADLSGIVENGEKHPAGTPSGPRYRCNECDYSSSHASHLRRHRNPHEHPGRFQCPICTYSAYQEIVVEEHLTKYHNGHKVPFSCSLCNFRCKSSFTLEGHTARHQLKGETDQHQCILCSYSAGSADHLIAHMSTGHYLGIFPWDNEGLNLHSSRDHPDDESPSTNKSTMDDDEDESNEEEPRPASKTEEVPVYHCPFCPCWKRYLSDFHYHILGHKPSSGFKCSKCKNHQHVSGHIRQEKEVNYGTHSSARVVFQPVPDHRYAAYLRPTVVPKGVKSRRFLLTTKEKKQEPARMRKEDRKIWTLRRKAVAMEGKVVEALEEAEGIAMTREKLRMRMQGGLDLQSLEKKDGELAVELKLAERGRIEAEKELQLLQQELKSLITSSTTTSS